MFSGSIGSVLVGVALLTVVVLFLVRPFMQENRAKRKATPLSQRQRLAEQKETLLLQIHKLDFDHDTGKIPDEVHQLERAQLVQEAAETLKILEALDEPPRLVPLDDYEDGADDALELAIAQRRQRQVVPATNGRSQGGYCPECGQAVVATDKFCAYCGHQLKNQLEPS